MKFYINPFKKFIICFLLILFFNVFAIQKESKGIPSLVEKSLDALALECITQNNPLEFFETSKKSIPSDLHLIFYKAVRRYAEKKFRNGKIVTQFFENHSDKISSIAITSNEEIIVSGSKDGTINIWYWNGQAYKIIQKLQGKKDINYVAITFDGLFVFASWTEEIKIWMLDNTKYKPIQTIQGDVFAITSNGLQMFSGRTLEGDRELKIWQLKNKQYECIKIFDHSDAIEEIEIARNDTFLFVMLENMEYHTYKLSNELCNPEKVENMFKTPVFENRIYNQSWLNNKEQVISIIINSLSLKHLLELCKNN